MKNSVFSNFLSSSIKIEEVKIENLTYNQRQVYDDQYGDIEIVTCSFFGCSSTNYGGGAVYIFFSYVNLYIFSTTFGNCNSLLNGGSVRVSVNNASLSNICIYNSHCGKGYQCNGIDSTCSDYGVNVVNRSYFMKCSSKKHKFGSSSARLSLGYVFVEQTNITDEYSEFDGSLRIIHPYRCRFTRVNVQHINSKITMKIESNNDFIISYSNFAQCTAYYTLSFIGDGFVFQNCVWYFNNGELIYERNVTARFFGCSFDIAERDVLFYTSATFPECQYLVFHPQTYQIVDISIPECENHRQQIIDIDINLLDRIVLIITYVVLGIFSCVSFIYQFKFKKYVPEPKSSRFEKQLRLSLPLSEDVENPLRTTLIV